MERMAMEDLENRRLYRIRSRNLVVGVWDEANHGFIGVREKFGSKYPFTEYHWDWDVNCGTVSHMEPMDEFLPDDIPVEEYRFVCEVCDKRVWWVHDIKAYTHIELDPTHKAEQKFVANDEIFEWLLPFDEAEIKTRRYAE
jgi:hypothetical protein